jgi:AcrR family transcriptional regulator
VVDAARRLFLALGYGATTIEAISREADVPPATVYRLFSSKLGILRSLIDVSIGGDDEDVPMSDRREVRSLADEGDPAALLAGFVGLTVQVNERVAPIYRILVSAAGTDPDAGALLDDLTQQRQQGQQMIARALARTSALRAGLRAADVADLVHALLSPEMYRLLVVDRAWTVERYEHWLTSTLADQLLADGEQNEAGTPRV